jgi:hypothetical protein
LAAGIRTVTCNNGFAHVAYRNWAGIMGRKSGGFEGLIKIAG